MLKLVLKISSFLLTKSHVNHTIPDQLVTTWNPKEKKGKKELFQLFSSQIQYAKDTFRKYTWIFREEIVKTFCYGRFFIFSKSNMFVKRYTVQSYKFYKLIRPCYNSDTLVAISLNFFTNTNYDACQLYLAKQNNSKETKSKLSYPKCDIVDQLQMKT